MAEKNHLFCFGYGFTARALARRIAPDGAAVSGTTRSVDKAVELAEGGVRPVLWDGRPPFFDDALYGVSHILVSIAPDADGDPVLRGAQRMIAREQESLRWIGYLSATSVYGDTGGEWVDEDAPLNPSTERGARRLEAEEAWRAFAAEHGLPLVIFRLAGIYGPGRSAVDSVRKGAARRIVKPGHVFNRIHVDDAAAAIAASMARPQPGAIYNLADDEPAPPQDAIDEAAALLGVAHPETIGLDDPSVSDMARSFYAEIKRVRNDRAKRELGWRPVYPSYREGLRAILNR